MSDASLVSKVLGWLEKNGYQVELRAGLAFKAAGWSPRHSAYYEDPETGKQREIDIRAIVSHRSGSSQPWCVFEFAVECKRSRDKPWVVFAGAAPPIVLPATVVVGDTAVTALNLIDMRLVGAAEFLHPGKLVGHGVARAFADQADSEGGSQPFGALRGATSAAMSIAKRWAHDIESLPEPTIAIVAPMVIVDAPMFRYSLGADGAEDLTPIEWARVRMPTQRDSDLLVTVVSLESLPAFLAEVTEQAKNLCRSIAEKATEIVRINKQAKEDGWLLAHG